MNIGIIGLGYVGLAQALLLDNVSHVIGFDINQDKIKMLKQSVVPFLDSLMPEYIQTYTGKWTSHLDDVLACDYIIIATPTN